MALAQGKLRIASCQFAVGGSIKRNAQQIRNYIERSSAAGAQIIHFSESALSGYAGIDMPSFVDYDWDALHRETEEILSLARRKGVWVILGSAHRLKTLEKPHNCLYLIGPDGRIADRYDKRFCLKAELHRYTVGDHFVVFTVNGVTCALLICFDLRFPEIYRPLRQQGVQCVFQSFYNARQEGPSVHSDIMVQSMQCRAASNAFWVSMCNSSAQYSPYGSCFIQPDGKVRQRLRRNRAGMMLNTVDLSETFYDPMQGFREMAMAGQLSNGVHAGDDPRSRDRQTL